MWVRLGKDESCSFRHVHDRRGGRRLDLGPVCRLIQPICSLIVHASTPYLRLSAATFSCHISSPLALVSSPPPSFSSSFPSSLLLHPCCPQSLSSLVLPLQGRVTGDLTATENRKRRASQSVTMGLLVKFLRAVIRNDSMKEDPDEIYGWRVFALVFAACFGGMLFGWDTGAISGVLAMDQTKVRFGYDTWDKSSTITMEQNIVSTLQAGCFAGCLITGYLTDRFGRRWCLIGCGALTTIGVVFQAASAAHGTIAVMYVGRFIAGVGVGSASTLTPLYVSECAPRAIRGALTCKSGICLCLIHSVACIIYRVSCMY
jgi:hypothetical protein